MKIGPLLLAALFLAAGCVSSQDWTRGQGTTEEKRAFRARLSNDEAECRKLALDEAAEGSLCGRANPVDDSIDARATRMCAFTRCMQAKGWKDYGSITPATNVRIVP